MGTYPTFNPFLSSFTPIDFPFTDKCLICLIFFNYPVLNRGGKILIYQSMFGNYGGLLIF